MTSHAARDQGRWWGRAAHDWAELQEPLAQPLWEAMLDAAAVGPGTHLLDAGCGAGGASMLAAGRGAQVNGLDAAAALLAIARERVPDGDFRLGDLEALPYADEAFDAVLAVDVLPYTARPSAAMRELARVCRLGGRVVVTTWGSREDCAQHSILRTVGELLPACLDEALFALRGAGVLESLVAQAGGRLLGAGEVTCLYDYQDGDMAWNAQAAMGPLQAALRLVGAGPVRSAVLQALAPYTSASGAIRLVNRFRYVTGCWLRDPSQGEQQGTRLRKGDELM